ncbi:polypeptide N-acetylgalactosaminyltransferase 13 isoform X2 [Brachionus plicatilis]|uniref:Polypeptide N-acetylgalactosaminyltransferase n=1 Tax=Brachionus plicatilis TaxID=10195 RepID=A0A3M7SBE9_BRAPC|nr:polypeptide N-acetylgalactosaminyltransferase 13 isoform X2 [Brachionus plicatilis]
MNTKTDQVEKSITKTIVLTSFIWLVVGAGFYHTLFSTRINVSVTDECQSRISTLEEELVKNRELYTKIVKLLPQQTVQENESFNKETTVNILPRIDSQPKSVEELLVKGPELETQKPEGDKSEWTVVDYSNEPTNPPEWPGENGRGVVIPEHLKEESKERFKENEFDIVASDLVALNRSIPDIRSESCKKRAYPVNLPTTSVVIVYHNEGNSTLLRGLTSICNKTPSKYLKEIILVDDASVDRDYLHAPLDQFVKTLPVPVKIIRNEVRMGLMRSRLRGANAASGDTLTFLDAHIECTSGWLQPLLFEIKKNRKAVVNPIIDVISYQNFGYSSGSEKTYGGFDAKFVFHWIPVPKREDLRRNNDESLPLRSPTMAGGLFVIERNFFYEIGAYDEGMDIWGAENIELSLRIWMCGGTLLILPCSHVGHVFRKKTPYKFPGGTNKVIFRNTRRVIEVWTDEYSKYFYNVMPDLLTVEAGNTSNRVELRKDLQCKSFRWYLDNIYPETHLPIYFYHLGSIKNEEYNFCLDVLKRKSGQDCGASSCHGKGGNQMFEYSFSKKLIGMGLCLESAAKGGVVTLNTCQESEVLQTWDYDEERQFLKSRGSGLCLTISELRNSVIMTMNCDPDNKSQRWSFYDPMKFKKK